MKRASTVRAEHERYADRPLGGANAECTRAVRTSAALLRQARTVLFFIKEGVSEQAPALVERELIRLIADVCLVVIANKKEPCGRSA